MYRWLRKNGFPKDRFRVLCFNCNCARNRTGGLPELPSMLPDLGSLDGFPLPQQQGIPNTGSMNGGAPA